MSENTIRKSVILTGATGGIGGAIVESISETARLEQAHTGLTITSRNDIGLEELKAAFANDYLAIHTVVADLASITECEQIVEETAKSFGTVTDLIHNAGFMAKNSVEDIPFDVAEKTIAINFTSMLALAKAALPYLKQQGGTIVATSSVAGQYPAPLGVYSSSKAALTMLIRQIAYEWGPYGIRANALSPGMVMTPMSPSFNNPELRDSRNGRIPVGRHADPADIANLVSFLISDHSSYISGQDIAIDGGVDAALYPTILGLKG